MYSDSLVKIKCHKSYNYVKNIFLFFLAFDFCRFCVVIRFFIPATTANDLRLRGIFYPRFYPLHLFSYLNSCKCSLKLSKCGLLTINYMYWMETLTRHSWIHYTDSLVEYCDIGTLKTVVLYQQSIEHMSIQYTHVTPILKCIGPCNLFNSVRSILSCNTN